jgi:hypothetical protein
MDFVRAVIGAMIIVFILNLFGINDDKDYSNIVDKDFEVLDVEYDNEGRVLDARICEFHLYRENCEQEEEHELTNLVNRFRITHGDDRIQLIIVNVYNDRDTYRLVQRYDSLALGTRAEGKKYLTDEDKLSARQVHELENNYIARLIVGKMYYSIKFNNLSKAYLPLKFYPLKGEKNFQDKDIVNYIKKEK